MIYWGCTLKKLKTEKERKKKKERKREEKRMKALCKIEKQGLILQRSKTDFKVQTLFTFSSG